jgi:transcriptional regulator with XRE-family HTH domain
MVLGERLRLAFKNAGIPMARVADHIGISQQSLYAMLKKDSFELDYLRKAAEVLGVPVSILLDEEKLTDKGITQTGDFNQAGTGNTQKVKVNKGQPQQDLVAALAACQRELALANALVASKDETITLLRASYRNTN